jgi:hypothetical protein
MRAIEDTSARVIKSTGTDGIESELRSLLQERRRCVDELRSELDCSEATLRTVLADLSRSGELVLEQRWSKVMVRLTGVSA